MKDLTFEQIGEYKKDLKFLLDNGVITQERYDKGLALAKDVMVETANEYVKKKGKPKFNTSGYDPYPDKRNNKPGWAP